MFAAIDLFHNLEKICPNSWILVVWGKIFGKNHRLWNRSRSYFFFLCTVVLDFCIISFSGSFDFFHGGYLCRNPILLTCEHGYWKIMTAAFPSKTLSHTMKSVVLGPTQSEGTQGRESLEQTRKTLRHILARRVQKLLQKCRIQKIQKSPDKIVIRSRTL